MSQYLNARPDWRWCIEGEDELCGVCPQHYTERQPASLELRLPSFLPPLSLVDMDRDRDKDKVEKEEEEEEDEEEEEGRQGGHRGDSRDKDASSMVYTGPEAVCWQRRLDEEALERFERDLQSMHGCCLLCRVRGKIPFDHVPDRCPRRQEWLRPKAKVLGLCKKIGKPWIQPFVDVLYVLPAANHLHEGRPQDKQRARGDRQGLGGLGASLQTQSCHSAWLPSTGQTPGNSSRSRVVASRMRVIIYSGLGKPPSWGGYLASRQPALPPSC